jgi:hypothetical protein
MQADQSAKNLKQKAAHEFEELAVLTAYLAFFFGGLATYSMLLLNEFHISYFAYGTALINAFVIAKVILIGEAVRAGAKFESKALLYSALWKAFVFAWLVIAFHLVEEVIKGLLHGETIAGAFHDIRIDHLLVRAGLIFFAFIPLFVLRELRRVMGHDHFLGLFFQSASSPKANSTE